MTALRPHNVTREDRADGTILLGSGHPMSPVTARTTDWLDTWARETPEALFLAERAGEGWRETPYGEAHETVDAIAGGLLSHGISPGEPLMVLSGNSIDHGLLTLACQKVGIPTVPLAEQYSLIPGAHVHITDIARRVRPAMVYAADGEAFARSLALEVFEGVPKLVSKNAGAAHLRLDILAREGGDISGAAAAVGPETVVKILMTSGSTSSPKGVETTHAMMCANQAQVADAFPFLRDRPPRLLDWLPWNHVFGSSHNFNLVLANGGSMHIDAGKPVPHLVGETIRNAREISPTIAFNVPVGFAMLRDAMREDPVLKERYFSDLDMLFYAGASLPQDVWVDLEAMALEVRGDIPLFTSSWGLTETAPAALAQHEGTAKGAGIVGVPMTGVTVKALPQGDGRYEIRVKGPNVFKGYLHDPGRTAEAFDDEGFFISGDAMRFVDENDMSKGLRFDGRLTEDFKLMTGTWVRAATLRLDLLVALKGLVQDIAITGEGREDVGVLAVPAPTLAHEADNGAARLPPEAVEEIRARLAPWTTGGSAARITRLIVMTDPPSMADGEITAKGNLNFRRLLQTREDLVNRLYGDDPCTIRIGTDTP